jgi:lipopolysaccharide transport system ATP-binding protein
MFADSAIEVRGLGKSYQIYEKPHHRLLQMMIGRRGKPLYHEFQALKDISFSIPKGKVVGILGKNGAGKSTLLQLVCGTLAPSKGEVQVNGRVAALLELGSGFNPEFTGIENVYMNAQILGLTREQTDAKLTDILAFANIGEFIYQPVKVYSSGMFARLAFSVAISVDPDVLIVDEVLSVGDAWFQHKSMARMRRMMESGVSVLFVSHSIEAVRALCDEAIWLEQGQIKMKGNVTEVTNAYMNDVFVERNKILLETTSVEKPEKALSADIIESIEHRDIGREKEQKINSLQAQAIKLLSAELVGESGCVAEVLRHNEIFKLKILLSIGQPISNINLGFIVTDRFGQELIGGNLIDSNALIEKASIGEKWAVTFYSKMRLRGGQSYAISLRITQGKCKKRTDMIVIATYEQYIVFDVLSEDEPSWLIFDNEYEVNIKVIDDEKKSMRGSL